MFTIQFTTIEILMDITMGLLEVSWKKGEVH